MTTVILTFSLTTGVYGWLMWLACHRVARHVQDNPEAIKAVTDHVLFPMLGRQAEQQAHSVTESESVERSNEQ